MKNMIATLSEESFAFLKGGLEPDFISVFHPHDLTSIKTPSANQMVVNC